MSLCLLYITQTLVRTLHRLFVRESDNSSCVKAQHFAHMYQYTRSRCAEICFDVVMLSVHYIDVIMTTIASQITSLTVVYSTVYSDADQRKHQSSASLAFVWGPVNSPHKGPVTRKMFPFDDVTMYRRICMVSLSTFFRIALFKWWQEQSYDCPIEVIMNDMGKIDQYQYRIQ